jgi:hypothetical protein
MRLALSLLMTVLAAAPARARDGGDVAGNGGDGFSVGDAVQLFDDVEFAEDFVPGERPEYRQFLLPQIARLKSELRLPAFTKVLEDSLLGRTTLWHFVNVHLRDVPDEGSTNVVLAYNKVQIAINRANLVQIDRAAFEMMRADSRARLFLHEALWTGLDGDVGPHGDTVRQLVALIARDSLPPRPNFINFVRDIVGNRPLSPLLAALNDDAATEGTPRPGCKDDMDGRFVSSGGGCKDVTSGLIWSKLRSDKDPSVLETFAGRAQSQYGDPRNGWSTYPVSYLNSIFCRDLRDGGFSDWRTPTTSEVFTLDSEALRQGLLSTPAATGAERVWLVDESYRGPNSVNAAVFLRSLAVDAFEVFPYQSAGIVGDNFNGGQVVFSSDGTGPLGYAVFCVRAGSRP